MAGELKDAKLAPAAENPWYVLATVAGEQTKDKLDEELHTKNRRFWNGWMCRNMGDPARQNLAKKLGLFPGDLHPLNEEENQQVVFRLNKVCAPEYIKRMREDVSEAIDFSSVYFSKKLSMEQFYFPKDAHFVTAHFGQSASFSLASFQRVADFSGSHFASYAEFMNASFAWDIYFRGTNFINDANFRDVQFASVAGFTRANFLTSADFSQCAFKGRTSFKSAHFKTLTIKLYHSDIRQDTIFTPDPKNWPEATSANADENKQAYIRLRQFAAGNHDPNLEHFFLRQEMRCKETLAKGLDGSAFWLYRVLSDSGISVNRPALSLFFMWYVPGIVYVGAAETTNTHTLETIGHAFGLSFSNLFPFLGLGRLFFEDTIKGFNTGLALLAGIQTVTGVVLLFLLGLGLRNRFRFR